MTAAKESTGTAAKPVDPVAVDVIRVERLGGLAGVGLGGSHLRSRGQVAWADLTAADQAAVTALFTASQPPASPASQSQHRADPVHGQSDSPVRDGFRYRLTRITFTGDREPERVEPACHDIDVPESQVPQVLVDCVQDELD